MRDIGDKPALFFDIIGKWLYDVVGEAQEK